MRSTIRFSLGIIAILGLVSPVLSAAEKTGTGKTPFALAPPGPGGASNLTLAPDLSFTDDSSGNFPIRGDSVSDGKIASDRPTAIFFGTSHCWNTAREAERFVALYAKEKESARFLVVDLEHQSKEQRPLVARLFPGSIPTVAFLDKNGTVIYDKAGETASARGDSTRLEELLKQASAGGP